MTAAPYANRSAARYTTRYALCGFFLLAAVSCAGMGSHAVLERSAPQPGSGWTVCRPAEAGMDETLLAGAVASYVRRASDPHDIVVARNGNIVFTAAMYPYPADCPHALMSCTKSVLSILIGIAIDEKAIPGVHTPLSEWFPELSGDPEKSRLELYHLMTMTAGLSWREAGTYGPGDSYLEMLESGDPVGYFLSRSVFRRPGDVFVYNSGAAVMAGIILEKAVGMDLLEYAESRLFGPLGIVPLCWQRLPGGGRNGASGLYLTAEDMARIGLLAAREGKWGNRRIVSAKWIRYSTGKRIDTPPGVSGDDGYGLFWWMNSEKGFSARGFGGQYILVYPEEDLVVVTTGGLFRGDHLAPDLVLGNGILESLGRARSDPEAMRSCGELFSAPDAVSAAPGMVPGAAPGTSAGEAAGPGVDPAVSPRFLGVRYRFEDGTTFLLSRSEAGEGFLLSLSVNGNDIVTEVPADGTYVPVDFGSFGALPENRAMLAISRITADSVDLDVRRLGVPYRYVYSIAFSTAEAGPEPGPSRAGDTAPAAVWTAYVSYLRDPFERYDGWPEEGEG